MQDREFWALMGDPACRREVSAAELELPLANMVQVRVDRTRKLTWFQHDDLVLEPGQRVVVETERGTGSGEVLCWPVKRSGAVKGARRVLRPLEPGHTAQGGLRERSAVREQQALRVCADLISTFQLDMKLVGVEHVHWENRAVFYFVAEGRVDFRDLVKELSRVLRCRIEMRQIGPRDETKMLGGLGRCGREFCCGTFLNEFRSVRTKMAKEQGLVVNQEKITGHCRKLLCCLAYERESYAALRASLPPLGATVENDEGAARVLEVYLLKQAVKIQSLDKPENVKIVPVSGLRVQGGSKLEGASLGLDDGDDEEESLPELEDNGTEAPREGKNGAHRSEARDRGRGERDGRLAGGARGDRQGEGQGREQRGGVSGGGQGQQGRGPGRDARGARRDGDPRRDGEVRANREGRGSGGEHRPVADNRAGASRDGAREPIAGQQERGRREERGPRRDERRERHHGDYGRSEGSVPSVAALTTGGEVGVEGVSPIEVIPPSDRGQEGGGRGSSE